MAGTRALFPLFATPVPQQMDTYLPPCHIVPTRGRRDVRDEEIEADIS